MIQRLDLAGRQLADNLPPAYHRAGGDSLRLCLETAQALVDELEALLGGPGREDALYLELLGAVGGLTSAQHAEAATSPGLVSLLSSSLPGVKVWSGVSLARVSSSRVRVQGPPPRGGIVLAWPRARLEKPPREALSAKLLPPGVRAQGVILDQEPETADLIVGQVLKAELFWDGLG